MTLTVPVRAMEKVRGLTLNWQGVLRTTLVALVLVGLLVTAVYAVSAQPRDPWAGLPVQRIQGVFADVDGDGLVDFIIEARVIYNVPFQPTPQPTP